jgi:hypothetical protein
LAVVATGNFFAALRTTTVDSGAPGTESTPAEEAISGKSGWRLSLVLSATNLIQLQKQLKGEAKQMVQFHSIGNRTRVLTKHVVDYHAMKAFFENMNWAFSTF